MADLPTVRLPTSSPGEVGAPGPEDIRLPTPTSSEFRASSPLHPDEPRSSTRPKSPKIIKQAQEDTAGASTSYWVNSQVLTPPPDSDTPDRDSAKEKRPPTFSLEETWHPLRESRQTQTSNPETTEQPNRGRSPTRQLLGQPTALGLPNTVTLRNRSRSPAPVSNPARANASTTPSRFLVPSPSVSRSPSPVRAPAPRPRTNARPPISARIRRALGLATPKASLIWRLGFGMTEIVVIGVLLGLASRPGSAQPIPGDIVSLEERTGMSQWEACGKPIAAWDIVWGVKAFLGMLVAWWEYQRAIRPSVDQILAVEQARLRREARRARRARNRPSTGGESGMRSSGGRSGGDSPIIWTRGAAREADLDAIDAAMRGTPRSLRIVNRMHEIRARREREERWYSRCSTLQALYGLVWFIAAQILLYGSARTCRWTSPYIWWLGFAFTCLGYIVVAEMLAVALVVFVLGPLVYLTINLILVCLGRHPMQPGGRMTHINPDVPKMSRSLVDRIPLVMYIPVPIPPTAAAAGDKDKTKDGKEEEHVYPPTPIASPPAAKVKDKDGGAPAVEATATAATATTTRQRRRFFFFKRKKPRVAPEGKQGGEGAKGEGDVDLEAGWERNEYPFVKLEANRAACAICLMDFEPPRRVGDKGKTKEEGNEEKGEKEEKKEKGEEGMEIEEEKVASGSDEGKDEGENKVEEAGGSGEAAEPLRLLACGHVFHRECLDPWLVDVSGRCPTCQRPVEEDDLEPEDGSDKKKKKKQRRA